MFTAFCFLGTLVFKHIDTYPYTYIFITERMYIQMEGTRTAVENNKLEPYASTMKKFKINYIGKAKK